MCMSRALYTLGEEERGVRGLLEPLPLRGDSLASVLADRCRGTETCTEPTLLVRGDLAGDERPEAAAAAMSILVSCFSSRGGAESLRDDAISDSTGLP
jgi:hypothetical protein